MWYDSKTALRGCFRYKKMAIKFIKESIAEMSHVAWPTGKQAAAYTALVLVVSIAIAVFLGALDEVFGNLVARAIETVR